MPPPRGRDVIATPLTAGALTWLPLTLRPESAPTAACASPASVAPSREVMLPPPRLIALAAMLMPSASSSAAATVYRKDAVRPKWVPQKGAARVRPPMSRVRLGVPVTLIDSVNSTRTSIVSPRRYVSPLRGEEPKKTLLTAGPPPGGAAVGSPTLRVRSAGTAAWVSTAAVAPSIAVMLPPLRWMAFAATLSPSASASDACTVYWKPMPWTSTP